MKTKTLILSSVAAVTLSAVAFAGHGAGQRFEALDIDGDGQVTRAEFQSAAAERISAADTDGDGAVTAEEMKQFRVANHSDRKAAFMAKLDADGNGELSRDEAGRMPEDVFNKLDADGNGSLSQAELAAGRRHHGAGKRAQYPAQRFAKLDTNHDGSLSPEEVQRMPEVVFQKLDSDSDGLLSVEEFSAGRHKARGKLSPGKLLKMSDTNGDGRVDVQEAQSMAAAFFAKLDKNSDGVLTREEMRRPGQRNRKRGSK